MIRPTRRVEVSLGVKDSRFVALLSRVDTLGAAEAALDERAAGHPDATHHCWAYRVWERDAAAGAGFDAGEPSGTAGRPILGALERADVVQVVCVVSRWFGGTKLGTGGLKRAYASAAAEAVRAARGAAALEPVVPRAVFDVRFDYDATAGVRRAIARFGGRETDAAYGERVELEVSVDVARAGAFVEALAGATADTAEVRRLDPRLERL